MGTLDLSATLQYANRLREQRERARIAEEKRRKSEEEAKQKAPEPQPVAPQPKAEPVATPQPDQSAPTVYTRAFKVWGTKEQIIALGNYMNENGIEFEKIDLTIHHI